MNNISKIKQDQFDVLRKVHSSPNFSQRNLAIDLGFSLGKLNYCLNELRKKGLIKIRNFQAKEKKLSNLKYILTAKGLTIRTKLTINFMKKKFQEYEQLKKELENVDNSKNK
jgi:EPS-associated MarR family transcriptional regulator